MTTRIAKRRSGALWTLGLGALLCAFGSTAAEAGVVITQEVTKADGTGKTTTDPSTVMIEGNRMKMISPEGTMIFDLDKSSMIVLNEPAKTATEVTLSSVGDLAAGAYSGDFKPTGRKRTVAGYPCEEYKHEFKTLGGEVSTVSCISKEAPGAEEAAAFYRRMAEKVAKGKAGSPPKGIALAEEADIKPTKLEMPGLPPEMAKQIAQAQSQQMPKKSKVVVTSVKTQALGPEVFAAPAGFEVKKMEIPQTPATIEPMDHHH